MKLLIIGSGQDWEKAPYADENYEVWTYGLIAKVLPRVSAVFEMHRRQHWKRFKWKVSEAEYIEMLNKLDVPVFMIEAQPDIPKSVAYPLEKVEQVVGPHFASTISYQIALAIARQVAVGDVEEIALYGFTLNHWEEWAYQRPNVNRLIGHAERAGIKVTLPEGSMLVGVPWKYGYEVDRESTVVSQALLAEHYAQLASIMNKIGEVQLALHFAQEKEAANPGDIPAGSAEEKAA